MKYIFILIFSMITTISLALGFVDPDAPKKDPEWARALKYGAKAKIELHVVDDDGIPVPNAKVRVIMGMISTAYTIKGLTNTNGVYVIDGKTKGDSISITIGKEGYYYSNINLSFIELGKERQVKNRKWQPYGEKMTILLREKRNPIEMSFLGSKFNKLKKINEWIGYDLMMNDFVYPHGEGKISDFDVYAECDAEWKQKKDIKIKIRFNEQYAGYYTEKTINTSDFRGQYTAKPNNLFLTYTEYSYKYLPNGEMIDNKFDRNVCLIIRSRCKVNEKGELISANYSTIFNILFYCDYDNIIYFKTTRAFNKNPNDLNLEPKHMAQSAFF